MKDILITIVISLFWIGLFFLFFAYLPLYNQPNNTNNMGNVGKTEYRLYPNVNWTPGVIMETNAQKLCINGYAKSVRNVNEAEKRAVFKEYGINYPPSQQYEVDHFINLSIGGSNDIKNLWPMPAPEFKEKDKMEFYVWKKMCKGQVSQQEAVIMIRKWDAYYKQIFGNLNLGGLQNDVNEIMKDFQQDENGND